MAITTWTGTTNSDWDTATNWSSGSVPTSSDTAIIDGDVDITGGEPSNEEVERVYVAYTYTGSLGSSGTPLELDVAQFSYDSSTSSAVSYVHLLGVANATPDVVIAGAKTSEALYLSGDIDRLTVESGFAGTLVLGNSASFQAAPKDVIMLASNGTIAATNSGNYAWVSSATILMTAGTISISENFGASSSVIMSGGTISVTDWTKVTGDSLTMLGGTCNWGAGAKSFSASEVNTIVTLNMVGGTFSLANNANGYVGFDNIFQYGGAIDMEASYANVEINTTYERFGGTYTPPKQSTISTSAL